MMTPAGIAILSARVLTVQTPGKRYPATAVRIYDGLLLVARATLGGRWTAEQAVREYRRLPARFVRLAGPGRQVPVAA